MCRTRETKLQRRWLKRRPAVESAIRHLNSSKRMDHCWLQGVTGNALHAMLCATGYILCWLLRAMVRLGLKALLLRLEFVVPLAHLPGLHTSGNVTTLRFAVTQAGLGGVR